MRGLARIFRAAPRAAAGTALAALLLVGCTVGPDYRRPEVATPEKWRIDYGQAADVANTRWWEQFGDVVLNGLIEEALRGNLDIRLAAARVDRFIGGLTTTRSQFYPQFGYSLDAGRSRSSRVGQPPIPTPAFTRERSAPSGRSTCSAASAARARRPRRRSMRPSRADAASCCRW